MQEALFGELLVIDIELRRGRGEHPALDDYLGRFPDRAEVIERALRNDRTEWTTVRGLSGLAAATEDGRSSTDEAEEAPPLPARLGRYIPTAVLGTGGFATVYLARDDELGRRVAIKVPHPAVVASRAAGIAAEGGSSGRRAATSGYRPGARHQSPGDDDLFVVLEYVSGRTLGEVLLTEKLPPRRLVEILASVAEAVHCAPGRSGPPRLEAVEHPDRRARPAARQRLRPGHP